MILIHQEDIFTQMDESMDTVKLRSGMKCRATVVVICLVIQVAVIGYQISLLTPIDSAICTPAPCEVISDLCWNDYGAQYVCYSTVLSYNFEYKDSNYTYLIFGHERGSYESANDTCSLQYQKQLCFFRPNDIPYTTTLRLARDLYRVPIISICLVACFMVLIALAFASYMKWYRGQMRSTEHDRVPLVSTHL